MPAGRPTMYTQAMADEICHRLAQGESLRSICDGPPNFDPEIDQDRHSHMPDVSTVLRWAINPDHEFNKQYEEARAAQAEGYADRMLAIADEEVETARARLKIDTMKWIASRLMPKRYGTKVQAEVSDPGGEVFGTAALHTIGNIINAALNRPDEADDDDIA